MRRTDADDTSSRADRVGMSVVATPHSRTSFPLRMVVRGDCTPALGISPNYRAPYYTGGVA